MNKKKSGRPAAWGERQRPVTVTLPPRYIDFLSITGSGNVSEGVRILIKRTIEKMETVK